MPKILDRKKLHLELSLKYKDVFNYIEPLTSKKLRDSVKVSCKKHGLFNVLLCTLIKGCKCPTCVNISKSMEKTLTTEEFVKRAKEVHGDKYDYSKVKYSGYSKDVCIICPEHGEFWQTPNNHLHKIFKCGCPKCSGNKHMTTLEFIKKLNEIYPNNTTIIYDKIEYINNNTPVTLTCLKHGEFQIKPTSLLYNMECPECRKERLHNLFSKTTEEFINEAKKIHGSKYDYSLTIYKNRETPVEIICKKHGIFKQKPSDHLIGHGCQICAKDKYWSDKRRITTKEIIERFKNIHDDRYDYSKVEYKTRNKKVCIICPVHGEFWQTPMLHQNGSGCPLCSYDIGYSKGEREMYEFVKTIDNLATHNTRKIIKPQEIDVFSNKNKVGFEYNGLYWHSIERLPYNYHYNKWKKCIEKNIRLLQFYEDEWIDKNKIVKSLIEENLSYGYFNVKEPPIIKELEKSNALDFVNENFILNNVEFDRCFCVTYNNIISSLMCFEIKNNILYINCFCNNITFKVENGFKILIEYIQKTLTPSKIIYELYNRLFNENDVIGCGFIKIGEVEPSFEYIYHDKRFKDNPTNNINCNKIYDCGKTIYQLVV